MNFSAAAIEREMFAAANPEKAAGMLRFFKSGPGQYGEGDRFLGLGNPAVRNFVGTFRGTGPEEAFRLLESPWHEVRLAGLLLLVHNYRKGDEMRRETVYRGYLARTERINNWDLVDLSAPGIVGEHLLNRERGRLQELAASSLLWDQRIAMISTLTLIRHGDFSETLKLAERFLTHRHDLMHKAVGWMLREIGKRDRPALTEFLNRYRSAMPRTALRYAIEHYPEAERRGFLKHDS